MSRLYSLRGIRFAYEREEVLHIDALEFDGGEMVSIAGPNGAGKSTLLSLLAGLREGYKGQCLLEGVELRHGRRRQIARKVSFVPQTLTIAFPFTVEQVVLMGRTPYCDGMFESPDDLEHVRRAMEITDCASLAGRDFRSLSGGERQRVILAAALAQTPKVLLLDEPTTFLDLRHQLSVYEVLAGLARNGLLVVSVTHDLNLARGFATRTILMERGRIAADGPTPAVLTAGNIRRIFEVDAQVCAAPDGRTWIRYGP